MPLRLALLFGLGLVLHSTHALAARPTLSGTPLTHDTADGRFLIHYTLEGIDALPDLSDEEPANGLPDTIDDVELGFKRVWEVFVDEDGWPFPPPDEGRGGDDRLDIYIRAIDANGYAHYEVAGAGHTTWFDVDNEARNLGSLTAQSIAGHELHHGLQAAYTTRADSFVYEMTSTWAQYLLFTGTVVMDVARQVLWNLRLAEPHRPFFDEGERFEYAGMMWIQFLLDHGKRPRSAAKELWQHMADAGDWELGHRNAMAGYGFESLEEAIATFHEWNLFACFLDDGHHYDPLALPCEFETQVTSRTISSFPGSITSREVGRFGATYVQLNADCSSQKVRLVVRGSGPFAVRGVHGRSAGGPIVVSVTSAGGDETVELDGWNDHPRNMVVVVNLGEDPQVFTVEADVEGTYVPAPRPDGALQLAIAPSDATTLKTGESLQLTATGRFLSCADDADIAGALEWQTSNPAVVEVVAGNVTAKGPGDATVHAFSGTTESNRISVHVPAEENSGNDPPAGGCTSSQTGVGVMGWLVAMALRRRRVAWGAESCEKRA